TSIQDRHSGEGRNLTEGNVPRRKYPWGAEPVRTSDIHENNQIDELDPGLRRGDERGDSAEMNLSQPLRIAARKTARELIPAPREDSPHQISQHPNQAKS
ncbi:hypothetical protein, partial [Propionivibrio sp.]|uniref:hypothetical protein n=1 Tax=Propionivibrio sp. TaxID=2212460 RepID=UPI003BF25239